VRVTVLGLHVWSVVADICPFSFIDVCFSCLDFVFFVVLADCHPSLRVVCSYSLHLRLALFATALRIDPAPTDIHCINPLTLRLATAPSNSTRPAYS